MFDISFFEIMIISIIGLIVIGPERLPQVARTLGHLMGRCRQLVYSVKTDIHNELRMEELKKMQDSVQETVHSIENSVRQEINELKSTAQLETATGTEQTENHPETKQLVDSDEKSNPIPDQQKPSAQDKTSSQ